MVSECLSIIQIYQFNVYIMYVHTNAHGCSATFIPAVICQLSQATLHMVTISTISAWEEKHVFICLETYIGIPPPVLKWLGTP